MKYIRQEHIITTVCKENLEDLKMIKQLFDNLFAEQLDVCIVISKDNSQDVFAKPHITTYSQARIKLVNESNFDLAIYGKTANFNIKNISFSDVVELKVITTKSKLVQLKDDMTRFDLIDIEVENKQDDNK